MTDAEKKLLLLAAEASRIALAVVRKDFGKERSEAMEEAKGLNPEMRAVADKMFEVSRVLSDHMRSVSEQLSEAYDEVKAAAPAGAEE